MYQLFHGIEAAPAIIVGDRIEHFVHLEAELLVLARIGAFDATVKAKSVTDSRDDPRGEGRGFEQLTEADVFGALEDFF